MTLLMHTLSFRKIKLICAQANQKWIIFLYSHALTENAKPRKRNCSVRLLILAKILYCELGYGRNYWSVILTANIFRLFLTCTRE